MEMTKEKRDLIITNLYDRCAKGEISRNQREKLIQKTNSMFTATESAVETESVNTTEMEKNSPKEKYEMFKESVYKKFSNGEITIETREILLEKARDTFFTLSK